MASIDTEHSEIVIHYSWRAQIQLSAFIFVMTANSVFIDFLNIWNHSVHAVYD